MALAQITTDAGGLLLLAAHFDQAARVAPVRAWAVVQHHGLLMQTLVKRNASGRPGPRMVTGDYNRSIAMTMGGSGPIGRGPTAFVGTNKAQGRRLEFGFDGADALGRVYHQPPYPHFGPAADAIQDPFMQAMADLTAETFTAI